MKLLAVSVLACGLSVTTCAHAEQALEKPAKPKPCSSVRNAFQIIKVRRFHICVLPMAQPMGLSLNDRLETEKRSADSISDVSDALAVRDDLERFFDPSVRRDKLAADIVKRFNRIAKRNKYVGKDDPPPEFAPALSAEDDARRLMRKVEEVAAHRDPTRLQVADASIDRTTVLEARFVAADLQKRTRAEKDANQKPH
ncbi:MAG TPA: hypothetical protein VMT99_04010 [Candidatus Paceibacterota bacterium]|nr:hypothetical protein [Candidatus Paceibacterota bacterium]